MSLMIRHRPRNDPLSEDELDPIDFAILDALADTRVPKRHRIDGIDAYHKTIAERLAILE